MLMGSCVVIVMTLTCALDCPVVLDFARAIAQTTGSSPSRGVTYFVV